MTAKMMPLMVDCTGASHAGAFDDPDAPTINLLLRSAAGEMHLVPVSLRAAQGVLRLLANWPPMQEFLVTQEKAPLQKPQ